MAKLASPEEIEQIPGIEPGMIEQIQTSVIAYYGQFETEGPASAEASAAEQPVEAGEPATPETSMEATPDAGVEESPGATEAAPSEGSPEEESGRIMDSN